jgi:hypothetical protein
MANPAAANFRLWQLPLPSAIAGLSVEMRPGSPHLGQPGRCRLPPHESKPGVEGAQQHDS